MENKDSEVTAVPSKAKLPLSTTTAPSGFSQSDLFHNTWTSFVLSLTFSTSFVIACELWSDSMGRRLVSSTWCGVLASAAALVHLLALPGWFIYQQRHRFQLASSTEDAQLRSYVRRMEVYVMLSGMWSMTMSLAMTEEKRIFRPPTVSSIPASDAIAFGMIEGILRYLSAADLIGNKCLKASVVARLARVNALTITAGIAGYALVRHLRSSSARST